MGIRRIVSRFSQRKYREIKGTSRAWELSEWLNQVDTIAGMIGENARPHARIKSEILIL
jgi:hypothetical protein